jgi:hypothetical protein
MSWVKMMETSVSAADSGTAANAASSKNAAVSVIAFIL